MKIILMLLLSLPIFAEDIGSFTNYYLKGKKAHFINPARLDELEPNQIYVESIGEVGFKKDSLFLGADKETLTAGYQLTENAGIEAFGSIFNGKGVENYGLTFGVNMEENYNFYLGFEDAKEGKIVPHFGLGVEAYGGALFAEYTGQVHSPKEYNWLVCYGKLYKNIIGDLTYTDNDAKQRTLGVTIGGKAHLFERLVGTAAITKELFFTKELKASTELQWFPDNKLEIYLINNFMAFGHDDPKYADFDINVGVGYCF